jgi:protein SCO1/2
MTKLPGVEMRKRTLSLLALAAVVLLAGCEQQEPWQTKDVSGLMPELEFELTRAADGETISEAAYAEKIRVVYFGFTNCPDVCPTTLAKFSQAFGGMEESMADRFRVLFISVDPERDTLERLENYAGAFVGLRGEIPYLRDLTKRYRVTFGYGKPDDNGWYNVSHSTAAFIFDPQGELRLLVRPDDSIDAIQADLERLAGAST